MLEQPKLLRRPLPPKLLPPLPPSSARQTNHAEITPWVKQPIEKITTSEETTRKERKVHILDYLPDFPIPEKKKTKATGFSTFLQAPTPPVSIMTSSLCEPKQKHSQISIKRLLSDQNEERSLVESSRPNDSSTHRLQSYDSQLLELMDGVPLHQLTSQFTLDDLITKSAEHLFVKENIKKPLISRYNYDMLVKRLSEELQKTKQEKVNNVKISLEDIQETSTRVPWRQILLEQKSRSTFLTEENGQTDAMDGKKRKFENPELKIQTIYFTDNYGKSDITKSTSDHERRKGRHPGRKTKGMSLPEGNGKITMMIQGSKSDLKIEKRKSDHSGQRINVSEQSKHEFDGELPEVNIPHSSEVKQFQDSSSANLHIHPRKGMEITPAEMALLKSLLHGGLALSLKAYFLDKVPDLTPLYRNLLYLNLSFNDLVHFPKEVYNIENLEVLKLRNNPIKEIPSDIHRLRNLRTFVISFCLISALPPGLFFLQHLQYLDVSYNSIPFIPNEIGNLRALDYLNVEGNELPALPCGALKLQLKQVRLGNNFMHPLLWKENSWTQPQRLVELAALFFYKNVWQYYSELPREAEQILNNFSECDCCKGRRYGQGIKIIRPCEKIFGVCKLPFMFLACSPTCYEIFMSQTSSLMERLYGD